MWVGIDHDSHCRWAMPTLHGLVITQGCVGTAHHFTAGMLEKYQGREYMPNYRRSAVPGARYFFTLVTYRRQPILANPESRTILRQVIEEVRQQHPFTIDAWVLLPDHMHCLWTLPDQDADYSRRRGMIKAGFTKQVKPLFQRGARLNQSRQRHREGTIWQRRFWEHQIRDEVDF
ncbi:hypothetical protein MNBD_GAMMA20-922, partial [hydrothermal vent metagenome]